MFLIFLSIISLASAAADCAALNAVGFACNSAYHSVDYCTVSSDSRCAYAIQDVDKTYHSIDQWCTCLPGYTRLDSTTCFVDKKGPLFLGVGSDVKACSWVPTCNPVCYYGICNETTRTCICHSGYTGPACKDPICVKGCNGHGSCYAPNICKCDEHWSGWNCSECNYHWTGPDCNTPNCGQNQCNNHGTCTTAQTCDCAYGWTGFHCEEPVCTTKCVNGRCGDGHTCECENGWQGEQCSVAYCSSCVHGNCKNPQTCYCSFVRKYRF